MLRRFLVFLSVLSVVSFAGARAQAQEFTRRSFVLPDGAFEITGEPARPQILRMNLSESSAGEPLTLAPHFYWGVTRDVTIGLTHREGFCLAGCGDRRYNDAGFGMLVALTGSQDFELDLHLGFQFRSFDPVDAGPKIGVIGAVNFGDTALVFDPALYVGVTEDDGEEIVLPVWFYFQATRSVVPFVGAMLVGPVEGFADNLSIPVEGGIVFEVSNNVDLGFYFRFYNLLGKGGNADGREGGLLARFRF